MKVALKVFIRSSKQVFRSRAQLVLIIGFPMILVATFAFIFGGGAEFLGTTSLEIGVINYDHVDPTWKDTFGTYVPTDTDDIFEKGFGDYFIDSLRGLTSVNITDFPLIVKNYNSLEEVTNDIKSRLIVLSVVIPEDFSLSILGGINYKINLTEGAPVDSTLTTKNASIGIRGDSSYQTYQQLQIEISDAINRFTSFFYGIDLPGGQFSISTTDEASIEFTAFDYYIPGFLIFGIILGAASIGFIVGTERAHGTLDRLRISRMSPLEYLIGLSTSQILVLSCQVAVMLVAAYLFGFNGQGNVVYSFIFGALATIPAIGFGLITSAIDKTGENASGIAAILSAPIGFLSGAFLPLPEVVLLPNFLPTGTGETRALQLWDFNPFSQVVRAQQLILLQRYDISQLLIELILFSIGGIIIFSIGALLFTLQVFKD
ncbi:MAG: ABC transporter permease [Candidatus Heimdallarchaeota archaeon]|nr:MAG: ABC transporter permease [Candidatus Heimdallarchaeota archaeon]